MGNWRSALVAMFCLVMIALNIYLALAGQKSTIPDVLRVTMSIISVSIAGALPLISFIRAEERYSQAESRNRERESCSRREHLLQVVRNRLFDGEDLNTIRANIMVVSDDELTMLSSVNMEIFPDHDMGMRYGQGCSGTAWKRALEAPASEKWKPVLALSGNLSEDQLREVYHLDEEQIQKTKHVLWILSTPMFLSSGESKFMGTLTFDGVIRPLADMGRIESAAMHKSCADLAEELCQELVTNNLIAVP